MHLTARGPDIEQREIIANYIWDKLLHTPYVWGGQELGKMDCSGLVVFVYRIYDYIGQNEDLASFQIAEHFPTIDPAHRGPGDVVCYANSKGKINHVAILLTRNVVASASGGNSEIDTVEEAMEAEAYIKLKVWDYREPVRVVSPFRQYWPRQGPSEDSDVAVDTEEDR